MIPVLCESLTIHCFVDARIPLFARSYAFLPIGPTTHDFQHAKPVIVEGRRLRLLHVSESEELKNGTNGPMASFLSRVGDPKGVPGPPLTEVICARQSDKTQWMVTGGDERGVWHCDLVLRARYYEYCIIPGKPK
jgi:hypothetical protein